MVVIRARCVTIIFRFVRQQFLTFDGTRTHVETIFEATDPRVYEPEKHIVSVTRIFTDYLKKYIHEYIMLYYIHIMFLRTARKTTTRASRTFDKSVTSSLH